MRVHQYRVFGLVIDSELELPELPKCNNSSPHLIIRFGEVPNEIENALWKGLAYEAAPGKFLLRLRNIGKFYVINGDRIIIQPNENIDFRNFRVFLLGTCMGAILHQRGLLPIHGSSILVDKTALIITGESSAGKSSLAAGFASFGYSIISDDISVITTNREGKLLIQPGIPHLKLWKDVFSHLGTFNKIDRIRPNIEKYRVSENIQFHEKPVLLDKIIVLRSINQGTFSHERLTGANKFNILSENTYRVQFVDSLGQSKSHFDKISQLAKTNEIYKIHRPSSPLRIRELVQYLEENILTKNEK